MSLKVHRVVVAGCPRCIFTDKDHAEGVGKSCFCNRFVRPDTFKKQHPSVLEETEWRDNTVYNQDHFLYWGAATKRLPDGSRVKFQVVEQTAFYKYDKAGSVEPFPAAEDYVTRASTTNFISRSKVAYRLHEEEEYAIPSSLKLGHKPTSTQLFPNFSEGKGVTGFICLFDPTLKGQNLKKQIDFTTKLLEQLLKTKCKVLLACTKCDAASDGCRQLAESLASTIDKEKPLPYIETSAFEGINIDEAFYYVAGAYKKVSNNFSLLYHDATESNSIATPLASSTQIMDTREHSIIETDDEPNIKEISITKLCENLDTILQHPQESVTDEIPADTIAEITANDETRTFDSVPPKPDPIIKNAAFDRQLRNEGEIDTFLKDTSLPEAQPSTSLPRVQPNAALSQAQTNVTSRAETKIASISYSIAEGQYTDKADEECHLTQSSSLPVIKRYQSLKETPVLIPRSSGERQIDVKRRIVEERKKLRQQNVFHPSSQPIKMVHSRLPDANGIMFPKQEVVPPPTDISQPPPLPPCTISRQRTPPASPPITLPKNVAIKLSPKSPSLNCPPNAKVRPPMFMNMKNRPLPQEPNAPLLLEPYDINDDWYDYPDDHRPPMPLPLEASPQRQQYTNSGQLSSQVSSGHTYPLCGHTHPQPAPSWPDWPIASGKVDTKHHNEGTRNRPTRSQSVKHHHLVNVTISDTKSMLSPMLGPSPPQMHRSPSIPSQRRRRYQYDYPIVGWSILPTDSLTHILSSQPIPKSLQTSRSLDKEEEYVYPQGPQEEQVYPQEPQEPPDYMPMDGPQEPEDGATLPSKDEPLPIYYNMRDRHKLYTRESCKLLLPPRQDNAPPRPTLPPKSGLIKQRITESKAKIRKQESMEKFMLGAVDDDDDTDEETGQKHSTDKPPVEAVQFPSEKRLLPQKPVLPPRDIIRPGWADVGKKNSPDHSYLPII